MSSAFGVAFLIPQWLATISAFWLIWWAAQTRDSTALKVIAILLAAVPAFVMPALTFLLPLYMRGAYGKIGLIFGIAGAVVGLSRALFLAIWAAVSKDTTTLRAIGGVIAGLIFVCYLLVGLVAVLATGGFPR